MCEYGFNENDDFIRVAQKCPTLGGADFESVPKSTPVNNGGIQMLKDYAITLDMAKEISMIQNKGEC